jgi:periplasmic divalent cation tolerance protein
MADYKFCQLWLTCENSEEATKIAKHLLDLRLVVCAKQLPLIADYWWEGQQEDARQTLLVMESKLNNFETIEKEVKKLHSYETFVLQAIPISKMSKKATEWMGKELK